MTPETLADIQSIVRKEFNRRKEVAANRVNAAAEKLIKFESDLDKATSKLSELSQEWKLS